MESAASSEFTAGGVTIPSITADEMRELDRIAIEETGPNLYQMMENAGRTLAELCLESLRGKSRTVLVVAGIGGNGGGGICAARHLSNQGCTVSLLLSRPDDLREIPIWQLRVYRATEGMEIRFPTGPDGFMTTDDPPRLIIDALLGYRVVGPPREPERTIIGWINSLSQGAEVPIVSLDLPSGLDATTGESPGEVVRATTTLTLALPKRGLLNATCTGALQLADIGIPARAYERIGATRPFRGQYRLELHAH